MLCAQDILILLRAFSLDSFDQLNEDIIFLIKHRKGKAFLDYKNTGTTMLKIGSLPIE
jgi:hypothetical protein